MIPRIGSQWERDVRQILNAAEIGLRWRDNIAPVVEFRYLASRAPVAVATQLLDAPLALIVLRAENRATRALESGCRVAWNWGRGVVNVTAIDVSDTNAEYDVVMGLVR